MKRTRSLTIGVLLAAALLLGLSACGTQGADGKAYLALDWTYTPLTVYFPMLPLVISGGAYYEHPAGTYYGEYTAWNWDFYSFWYTLEINEGSYGLGLWPGEDGADRFYAMFLNSWGPELYYFDDPDAGSKGTEAPGASPAERELALAGGSEPGRETSLRSGKLELDPGRYDLDNPEVFRWVDSTPGWSLTVEGQRYRLRERP
jgi:predicted small secreted protein